MIKERTNLLGVTVVLGNDLPEAFTLETSDFKFEGGRATGTIRARKSPRTPGRTCDENRIESSEISISGVKDEDKT